MIGLKKLLPPVDHIDRIYILVAGHHDAIANRDNRSRVIRRPVEIDHQPRDASHDRWHIEQFDESSRHVTGANVPGDVPMPYGVVQAKPRVAIGNVPAGVVANQQEPRIGVRVQYFKSTALAVFGRTRYGFKWTFIVHDGATIAQAMGGLLGSVRRVPYNLPLIAPLPKPTATP